MSSSSASTSEIVRFIFWTEIATPALMETRFATLALRLMSAWRLSTSSSMRPTERFGTLRTTSGGPSVEAEEPLPLLLLPLVVVPVIVGEGSEEVADAAVVGMVGDAEGAAVELS